MAIFTRGQSIDFIERAFGEGKLSNGGLNISVVCPNCLEKKGNGYNKKKLVIRTDNFVSHCWVCNTKSRNLVPWLKRWYPGYLNEYLKNYFKAEQINGGVFFSAEGTEEEQQQEKKETLTLPAGYKFLFSDSSAEAAIAKRYLSSRGIYSDRDYWYWKFGIAPDNEDVHGRVIIPSFDKEGNLNYWTARSYKKRVYPKYMNPSVPRESVIFNEINIDFSKPLTLVEGPFDLLKCNENATCLLGSTLNSDYVLFRKIVENETPVVLALDEDAKEKALQISKNLTEYGVSVTILSVPKAKGDVGAMTKEEFKSLQKTGQRFTVENYLLEKIRTAFK